MYYVILEKDLETKTMRDFFIWLSEGLFYLQSGEMLINTPWIFVWVVFWSLVMVSLMFYVINVRPSRLASVALMIVFFPVLLMAMGPGIVQMQMMQECETVDAAVSTDFVDQQTVDVRRCRYKDNFYGEFGEWEFTVFNR